MKSFKEVKDVFAAQIAEAMYMEPNEVPDDALFSSYGLESTTLVRIVNKVNEILETSVEINEILPKQSLVESSKVFFNHITGDKV